MIPDMSDSPLREKIKKARKSRMILFYQGGTKLGLSTVHTPKELRNMMEAGRASGKDIEIETVNEDDQVADDRAYVCRTGLMFYTIVVPLEPGLIERVPAGAGPADLKA